MLKISGKLFRKEKWNKGNTNNKNNHYCINYAVGQNITETEITDLWVCMINWSLHWKNTKTKQKRKLYCNSKFKIRSFEEKEMVPEDTLHLSHNC